MTPMLKSRARLVCVECHGRKVKCDLEESRDNTCGYCRAHNFTCIRRQGVRKRTRASQRRAQVSHIPDSSPNSNVRDDDAQALSERATNASQGSIHDNSAYIAEHSVLQDGDYDQSVNLPAPSCAPKSMMSGMTSELQLSILRATDAHKLPKPALRQALVDSFFTHLAFCFPVVDRADVESADSSVLLQQAVCLAGSLTRHPNLPDSFSRAQAIYEKIKILICINSEPNMLVVLKVLSLLTLWSPIPSHIVSLDGPWHSIGMALRLAIQMGMHKDATYANKPDRACRRRLWWFLYSSDCVLALIYGRIPALKEGDFDVSPLSEDDFEVVDFRARSFIADTCLGRIMGKLAHDISRNVTGDQEQSPTVQSLVGWIAQLPPDLHLYDIAGSRMPFCFPATELHIEYFGTVILSQARSCRSTKQWPCSLASLLAATCIASLYEEILYREQVAILTTMHPFWCLTAAIPLLYYKPDTESLETQRKESLAVLTSVVEQLRPRLGLANSVAHRITLLQNQRTEIITQQASPVGGAVRTQSISGIQDDTETGQLNSLFPQLSAWAASKQSGLHNPILDAIAQTQAQFNVQDFESTMQWISEGNLSGFDALGAPGFMDDFFGNAYGDGVNLDFQDIVPGL